MVKGHGTNLVIGEIGGKLVLLTSANTLGREQQYRLWLPEEEAGPATWQSTM
jgi:hypothetical protein